MNDIILQSLFICENAFFAEDKKLNLIGIFDEINVTSLPAIRPQMFISGVIEGEPNKSLTLKFEALSPKGENILPFKDLEVPPTSNGKMNVVISTVGITFKEIGKHTFRLLNENKLLGEAFLEIKRVNNKGGGSVKQNSHSK